MSISKVEIFNLALSACGADLGVSAPDERSREADLCRRWYDFVRDETIAAAPWPSVRAYSRLALISERDMNVDWVATDPAPRWPRQYATPSDMLRPYYLNTYERFEYSGGVISTAALTPILHYNRLVESPSEWDFPLRQTIIFLLAAHIARPLTGSSAIIQEKFQLAYQKISDMRATAANSEDAVTDDLPDWLQARNPSISPQTKFLYPFQEISSIALTGS